MKGTFRPAARASGQARLHRLRFDLYHWPAVSTRNAAAFRVDLRDRHAQRTRDRALDLCPARRSPVQLRRQRLLERDRHRSDQDRRHRRPGVGLHRRSAQLHASTPTVSMPTTRRASTPARCNHALNYGGDSFHDVVDTTGFGTVFTPSGERTVSGAFVQLKSNYSTCARRRSRAVRYDHYDLEAAASPTQGDRSLAEDHRRRDAGRRLHAVLHLRRGLPRAGAHRDAGHRQRIRRSPQFDLPAESRSPARSRQEQGSRRQSALRQRAAS